VTPSVEHVIVEADGGSRGNPGPAGYGAVVLDSQSRTVLAARSESLGVASNNVAEYRGLIAGLAAAAELGARRVSVRLDSKLVIEQMSGRWKVKHPDMQALHREATTLMSGFDQVSFEWIPREQNTRADQLANAAMDRAAGVPAPSVGAASGTPAPRPMWTPPAGRPTRLILVRHGSTEHSPRLRFSGRNDLPLDATGEQQAAQLAARVRAFGEASAIVSSPLLRARQTAQAIAARLGVQVESNDDLAELDFGTFEGKTSAEVQLDQPAELAAWLASPEVAPPGGESFAALARRVRRGRDAVIAAHGGQTVVVVTHVTPIKTLIRLALDAPPVSMFRIFLDTASISVVDYFADGNCSVRLVNGTAELD